MSSSAIKQVDGHTPGPWTVANGDQVWFDGINTVQSPRICTIQNASDPVRQLSAAEMSANARLIAAAPDLLAACRTFCLGVANAPSDVRFNDAARQFVMANVEAMQDAIRKATT